jgi:hypothetical protein
MIVLMVVLDAWFLLSFEIGHTMPKLIEDVPYVPAPNKI